MNGWLPGLLGVTAIVILALAFLGFIGTRRLLLSPEPSTPLCAILDGWRAVFALSRALPFIALVAFAAKLAQIESYSVRALLAGRSPVVRALSGVAIDSLFTLIWAAIAFQIYLFVLAPELSKAERRTRTWRAVIYALVFWLIGFALTIAFIVWLSVAHGRGHMVLAFFIAYVPYVLIILAALTRPAIATGLPRPFKECRRIVGENWLGIAVTMGLAVLPLSLIFYLVDLTRHLLHLRVALALILEVPIALCRSSATRPSRARSRKCTKGQCKRAIVPSRFENRPAYVHGCNGIVGCPAGKGYSHHL